jgi:hypothetical protein
MRFFLVKIDSFGFSSIFSENLEMVENEKFRRFLENYKFLKFEFLDLQLDK